jgi:hypothetical protein
MSVAVEGRARGAGGRGEREEVEEDGETGADKGRSTGRDSAGRGGPRLVDREGATSRAGGT